MSEREQLTVTNSVGFLALCRSAEGRNRSVHTERVAEAINPDGSHVLVFCMPHNDVELRTQWFVSFKDKPLRPVELWLDVDPFVLQKHAQQIDMPEQLRVGPSQEDDSWLDL